METISLDFIILFQVTKNGKKNLQQIILYPSENIFIFLQPEQKPEFDCLKTDIMDNRRKV